MLDYSVPLEQACSVQNYGMLSNVMEFDLSDMQNN